MMARKLLTRSTPLRDAWMVILLLAASAPVAAQLPSPELTSVYPPGAKQGTSVDVTIAGKDLDEVTALIFSHPGITAQPKMSASNGILDPEPLANQFTISIADNVPVGIYETRAVGRFGLSNPRAFQVGDLDEQLDDGANKTVEKARTLPLGVVVNGRVDASGRDYYKLSLKKGQQVLVSCAAQQLDSRMDATLMVYGPDGRELARNRDCVGTDPLIDFTAPADGEYVFGVYDFVYGGGNDYFYRLSVHARPHVDFIFPPSGLPGTNAQYTLYGRNLPGGKPVAGVTMGQDPLQQLSVNIEIPEDEPATHSLAIGPAAPPQTVTLDGILYQFTSPQGAANPIPLYIAQAPIVTEQEPNNAPDSAQQITVPCEYVGQFYPERDFDFVQFEAKKGEVYWIDLISHRLGLDSDPMLAVQRVTRNDKGEESVSAVANVDDPSDRNSRIGSDFDTSTDDPSYRFTVPADGTYRVMIRDQFGDGRRDPRYVYRLVIRPQQPDYRLAVRPLPTRVANANIVPLASAVLRKGGASMLEVRVNRRDGFTGEIEVAVEGLPAGVKCLPALIGSSASSATLILTAAEDAAAWSGAVRVVGKAKIGDREVTRTARAGSAVWGTTNRTQMAASFRLTRDLGLAVVDKEAAVAQVQTGEEKVWETSLGGKLEIPLKVARRNGFKGDMKLTPVGAPNEFKPKDLTVKGANADAKLALAIANAKTKPGSYTFYLKSDVKYKYSRNPDAIKVAEARQKQLVAKIAEMTKRQKEANAKKTAAAKAAADAAKTLKDADGKLAAAQTAAQKDADNQQLAEAVAAAEQQRQQADSQNKQAAEAKAAADKTFTETDALLKKATALKKSVDSKLASVKKANAAKDVTVTVVSTPIRLRIHKSPINLKAQPPAAPLKQGEKLEVPVAVERRYGFADQVALTLEAPKGVKGLKLNKLNLAKDKTEGKFEIVADPNATPGEHKLTIRAKAKFNKLNVESTEQLTLKVEEVKK